MQDFNKVTVVLGGQWGDEGKGKIVDLLSENFDAVCRCQGGNNAGHTVASEGISYDFHLLPSGIVRTNCKSIIGNGVVIHLPGLFEEVERLENKAPDKLKGFLNRLTISNRAHLVFDFHQAADCAMEILRGSSSLGTTKKGIGPVYASKALRLGLRIADLVGDFEVFEAGFRLLVKHHQATFPECEVNISEELDRYRKYREIISPLTCDVVTLLNQMLSEHKNVLVEGANATMLDIDFGTYPFVTSSSCAIGGVCTGLGIPPARVGTTIGVVKAYTTRVGAGILPTEQFNDIGKGLQERGKEFGVTTGRRRRCGWFDAVQVSYVNKINGFTCLALTKLDILTSIEELKIATAYMIDGVRLESYPADMQTLERVKCEYFSLPGWTKDISHARHLSDLPQEAIDYVHKIEDVVGVPIKYIGVGPSREAIIEISN